MAFDSRLLSPKERPLFLIGAIFSGIVWVLLIVSIVGLLYGAMILFFLLMGHALFLAHVKGNGVRISEAQLPDLYARVKEASSKLGLAEVPEVYVVQAGGALNAFATKLFSRKFVVIFSDLVDHCREPRQLDFVIGHELAHLAAGHLQWNAFLAPFRLLPWLGPAYSRAREYTCDRSGFFVVGDLEQSMRGLCVLAAGGRVAAQIDLRAFMDQHRESGRFWMSVLELVSSHPFLCKRVAALQELAAPGTIAPVRRNVFAFGLAPVLGMGAGGFLGTFAPFILIGYLAAVMVPAFKQGFEKGLNSPPPEAPSAMDLNEGFDDAPSASDTLDTDGDFEESDEGFEQ